MDFENDIKNLNNEELIEVLATLEGLNDAIDNLEGSEFINE